MKGIVEQSGKKQEIPLTKISFMIVNIFFFKWKNHFLKIAGTFFFSLGVEKKSIFLDYFSLSKNPVMGGITLTCVAALELGKTVTALV